MGQEVDYDPWIRGRMTMSKKWMSERRHDGYYKKAKKEGYRARSSYKLDQINNRYNIIKAGDSVLDLGAAPGGWSQVAMEIVGEKGHVVGVDIQGIEPLQGVKFLKGDMTKTETLEKIQEIVSSVDVVISDMSPNITGHYSMDHARSIELAEISLDVAGKLLKRGGNFVVKVFQGDLFPDYFRKVEGVFGFTKAHSPKASRKQSSEIYVIGKGFKG
jgi:23S rRNA (uridine2552-2'-O)-methyltransferase